MIPEGMRDVLPPEAGQLRAIEAALCRRFEAYGYGEVRTPWLEYAETLEAVEDDTLEAGYRLRDQQGHELMARTDMTVPVARLAAARFRDRPLPLRFFYVAPSIRPWAPQRSQDGEFVQAGAELLGLRSAAADAESVILLCDCLAALGLRGFRVALGTVAFYTALVDSLGLDDDREKFLEALADRDYPLLESIAGNAGVDEDALKVLWRTLELSGTRDALSQVRKMASSDAMDAAIRHLVEVARPRRRRRLRGCPHASISASIQDLTYYSGVIFEAYAPGVGLPIASGGRYDGLLRALRVGHPRRGLRHRRRPAARGARGGRRRALRALRPASPSPAGSTSRRGPWSCAAPAGRSPRFPTTRPRRRARACIAAAARTSSSSPTAAKSSGSWRDVLRALGIA